MSRRAWSERIRAAALGVVLVCGLGWALATAEAQEPPAIAVEAALVEAEAPSPWSLGLITSTVALVVGGLSSVLGIWVHRDANRPVGNAVAMTSLVVCAVGVGIAQGYLDAVSGIAHRADLDRMVGMVNELAVSSGDPALAELVRSADPAGR